MRTFNKHHLARMVRCPRITLPCPSSRNAADLQTATRPRARRSSRPSARSATSQRREAAISRRVPAAPHKSRLPRPSLRRPNAIASSACFSACSLALSRFRHPSTSHADMCGSHDPSAMLQALCLPTGCVSPARRAADRSFACFASHCSLAQATCSTAGATLTNMRTASMACQLGWPAVLRCSIAPDMDVSCGPARSARGTMLTGSRRQ